MIRLLVILRTSGSATTSVSNFYNLGFQSGQAFISLYPSLQHSVQSTLIPEVFFFNGQSSRVGIYQTGRLNPGKGSVRIQEALMDNLRAISAGSLVVILMLGLDGWTTNWDGLPDFYNEFRNLNIYLVVKFVKGDAAKHVVQTPSGVYGSYQLSALAQPTIPPRDAACNEILELWAEMDKKKKQVAEVIRDTRGRNYLSRTLPVRPVRVAHPVIGYQAND